MMMLAASVFLNVVALNHLCGRFAVVIMICCLKDRARQRERERAKKKEKEKKKKVCVCGYPTKSDIVEKGAR
jgi:hypothetical protein